MSRARASKLAENRTESDDSEGVTLTPEEEAELELEITRSDEAERAGRVIPLDKFLADRGIRR